MPPSNFARPYLYPKQEAAIFCTERFSAIEASTKSGKTVGSIAWLIEEAFKGRTGDNYWWCAPVYPQADIAYRRIKLSLTAGSFTAFASPQPRIELFTGGVIWIKSADNPDSLYGEDVKAAVGDEASRWKSEAWHALRSTLSATRGRCRLIGNVKGRKNFFYSIARRAEKRELPDWHYAKITWQDAVDAGVLDVSDVEAARRELPEAIFKELYEAVASDDTGNPFGLDYIAKCVRDVPSSKPVVAWGIDLAKKQDYLVIIGLDEDGNVAAFHRWTGIPWRDSIRRIHSICGEDTPVLVDSTGTGDPVLEELQDGHGNFNGFLFSQVSKQKLMEGLAVSIQGCEIGFPNGVIKNELDAFEYSTTPSGRIIYAAPEGHYDDCVCALALARNMLTEVAPGTNVSRYIVGEIARRKTAEAVELNETKPWRNSADPLVQVETLTNELTELYNETVQSLLPRDTTNCFQCGKPVLGPTRVTDGAYVWHPQCTTMRLAA